MKRINLLSLILLLSCSAVWAQDTLRLMHYNVFKFPGTTGTRRVQYLRKTLDYAKPDVLTVNELFDSAGADLILNQALNHSSSLYSRARFTTGNDTQNMLYFRNDKLGLIEQFAIPTAPRQTNGYRMYWKSSELSRGADTVYFNFWVFHLQASSGSTQEASRNVQTTAFRNYIETVFDTLPNTFVNGDYNIYTSAEAAYQTLLAPGKGQFVDPINRPGAWNNDATFAPIHTQSTHTTQTGGFATGGMDDRFDFILCRNDVMNGRNFVTLMPNTYRALGNDGQRFNLAINSPAVNTVLPDTAITNALYEQSDHCPVEVKLLVNQPQGQGLGKRLQEEYISLSTLNPEQVVLRKTFKGEIAIRTIEGKLISSLKNGSLLYNDEIKLPELRNGIYVLHYSGSDFSLSRRFIISK